MKKVLLAVALSAAASTSFADAVGGNNCGWGNMLFEGKSGLPIHIVAGTTNGSSGNASFGMTSGTNGCSANVPLSYGGTPLINLSSVMDEFSEDVARGDGEVITAVAVSMGISPEDRPAFKAKMHDNFDTIFPSENVTTKEVMDAMQSVMQQDEQLAKYVG